MKLLCTIKIGADSGAVSIVGAGLAVRPLAWFGEWPRAVWPGYMGSSTVLVTAPWSWTETIHQGELLSLSGIFWNECSKFLHAVLFVHEAIMSGCLLQHPFVSIKIREFGAISEACLHIKCGSPLKFVLSHIWHTLSLLELFILTNFRLPEKISFFLVWGGLYVIFFMPWYFRNSWVVFEGCFMLEQV